MWRLHIPDPGTLRIMFQHEDLEIYNPKTNKMYYGEVMDFIINTDGSLSFKINWDASHLNNKEPIATEQKEAFALIEINDTTVDVDKFPSCVGKDNIFKIGIREDASEIWGGNLVRIFSHAAGWSSLSMQ